MAANTYNTLNVQYVNASTSLNVRSTSNNTTEAYVTPNNFIIPTTVASGTSYHAIIMGWQNDLVSGSGTITPYNTFNVRLGANGNTNDPVIFTITTPPSNDLFVEEFYVTVRSNGTSGNLVVGSLGKLNGLTTSNVTIDTTKVNILGISHISWAGNRPVVQNNNIEIAILKQIL